MRFKNLEYTQEKISYSEELEKTLAVKEIVDEIEKEFDIFLKKKKEENIEIKNEIDALRLIKLFIMNYDEQKKIKSITSKSILSGVDCLTLSIITCLLAKRKGYNTKIGRPDKITRYFHSLIIRPNGEMFKVAGKSRNYKVKEMEINDVISRLKTIKSVINKIDSIVLPLRKYLKNLLTSNNT